MDVDLDMLAYDISAAIADNEHPLDVDQNDIRAALPAFIEQITRNAAREA